MPTTNPVPSTDPTDLLFNAGKLDEVVNGAANSFTDRLGIARRTVAGMNADFDAQLADAESDLNVYRADAAASAGEALGYLQTIRATSYGAYANDPATDPLGNPPTVGDEYFNTAANLLKRWNGATWQASDINTANLAAPSGTTMIGHMPEGEGAAATDLEKKLREMPHLNGFTGTDPLGVSQSNTGLLSSIQKGTVSVSGNYTYLLDSFLTNTNDPAGKPVRLVGDSIFKTTRLSDPVIQVAHNYLNTSGHILDGITFTQPNDPAMAGGTANNHFCVSMEGVSHSRLSNLKFVNPDLCIKFEYGAINVPDVACYHNVVTNVVGYGVRGMGLQLFGSKHGSFTNLVFEGTNGSGGRAQFHGLRLNGVDDGYFPTSNAKNVHNFVQLTVKKFGNGASLQQNSHYNTVFINAEDCTNAVGVHGVPENVGQSGLSKNNTFHVIAKSCGYALYDGGGSYNTFHIDADGCTTGGIFAQGDSNWATTGRTIGNTYAGTIRNSAVTNLAEINGVRAKFDLTLIGISTAETSRGLLLQGIQCSGSVNVSNCNAGLRVTGNNNAIRANVNNCGTDAIVITGSNNVLHLNTDGNVIISGNNNIIAGVVGGTIASTGTGNDWSGVQGYSLSRRYFSQVTDANGYMTITHNLGKSVVAMVSVYGAYIVAPYTSTDNSVTVRLYSLAGSPAINLTGLLVDLIVMPRM